jgi:hypothetical protein
MTTGAAAQYGDGSLPNFDPEKAGWKRTVCAVPEEDALSFHNPSRARAQNVGWK